MKKSLLAFLGAALLLTACKKDKNLQPDAAIKTGTYATMATKVKSLAQSNKPLYLGMSAANGNTDYSNVYAGDSYNGDYEFDYNVDQLFAGAKIVKETDSEIDFQCDASNATVTRTQITTAGSDIVKLTASKDKPFVFALYSDAAIDHTLSADAKLQAAKNTARFFVYDGTMNKKFIVQN